MSDAPAYGLWPLVALNSLMFIIFAFSFAKPKTSRDWRSLGAFSAFIASRFLPSSPHSKGTNSSPDTNNVSVDLQ